MAKFGSSVWRFSSVGDEGHRPRGKVAMAKFGSSLWRFSSVGDEGHRPRGKVVGDECHRPLGRSENLDLSEQGRGAGKTELKRCLMDEFFRVEGKWSTSGIYTLMTTVANRTLDRTDRSWVSWEKYTSIEGAAVAEKQKELKLIEDTLSHTHTLVCHLNSRQREVCHLRPPTEDCPASIDPPRLAFNILRTLSGLVVRFSSVPSVLLAFKSANRMGLGA